MKHPKLGRNKPIYERSFGSLRIKLYFSDKKIEDCFLIVEVAKTRQYHCFPIQSNLYRYAMACVKEKDDTSLFNAIWIIFTTINLMFDSEMGAENMGKFITVINEITSGLITLSKKNAQNTSEEEEQAAEADIEDALEYANLSEEEREQRRMTMRADINNIVKQTVKELAKDNEDE